jgi:arabinoxylan arabinofuranohydrolase
MRKSRTRNPEKMTPAALSLLAPSPSTVSILALSNSARWLSALSLGLVTMVPAQARADNPFVQTNYIADPAPMVHEGRLYVYASHDEDATVNNFYTMNDWRLYSTLDMVNWTDHGSPASLQTFNWSTDNAWAPQGIFRNGSYYLYLPINNNTGARIGVAVSDKVTGPFTDPLGKELVQTAASDIDPTVFIDDDGQAYMYWGNATLQYVTLNEDMISYSGNPTTVNLQGFTEGPWLYKRESLYYMVYAGMGGNTEKISYATSNSPRGPWTIRGDIMASGPTYTNHAGIIDYKGHSFFFYHNSALQGGNDFRRSVCVEEFTYGNDGSIPLLTMSDEGPAAVDTLNPFEQVEAETIAFSSGLKTETCTDAGGGMNVTAISQGDYIKVKEVDFLEGVTGFEARVSAAGGNAAIELHLDSRTGPLLGTCDVSGASSWTTVTCPVSGGEGVHDLFLTFTGGGDNAFKFNWWKVTGPTPTGNGTQGDDSTQGDGTSGSEATTSAGGATGGAESTGSGPDATSGEESAPVTSGTQSTQPSPPVSSVTPGTPVTPGTTGVATAAPTSSTAANTTTAPVPSASGDSTTSAPTNAANGSNSDSGCACRVGASPGNTSGWSALWLVASALVFRRRLVNSLR